MRLHPSIDEMLYNKPSKPDRAHLAAILRLSHFLARLQGTPSSSSILVVHTSCLRSGIPIEKRENKSYANETSQTATLQTEKKPFR